MPESYGSSFPTVGIQQGVRHVHTNGLIYRYLGGDPSNEVNWIVDGGNTSTDPDTSLWGTAQTGAIWYNTTEKQTKIFDGSNIKSSLAILIEIDESNNANINVNTGSHFRFTMTDDVGIILTGGQDGQKIVIEVLQDAAGSHTLTWSSNVRYSTDIPTESFIPSAVGGEKSYFGLIYNAADGVFDAVAVTKGFS